MGFASKSLYFALHPKQLKNIIQWKLQHKPLYKRDLRNETRSTKTCFHFLDSTGRSFSPVIQELHPELLMPICIFYLILRGLDTIEDDTSLPLTTKEPLLREFSTYLSIDDWSFNGNRAGEKDRELLVQFSNIIAEFKKLKPEYQDVITDITCKMGNGMADFAVKSETGEFSILTTAEYNLYCWHVAGIVGEGLTRLFIISGLAGDEVIATEKLYRSMGLLLQKNNIIRDIRQDFDDGRIFWPREIWCKHVSSFEDLFKPEYRTRALECSAEMVLDALLHVKDCLVYLSALRDESIFVFCAVPQAMALATLELCFCNESVFEANVKIGKGDVLEIVIESGRGLEGICRVYLRYVGRIRERNSAGGFCFEQIDGVCREIQEFATALAAKTVEEKTDLTVREESSWLHIETVFSIAVLLLVVLAATLFTRYRG